MTSNRKLSLISWLVALGAIALAGVAPAAAASDALYCEREMELIRQWIEGGKKKESEAFSPKDIQKMEELAQEPVIKQAIEDSFACLRQGHQDEAHAFNTGTGSGRLYQNAVLQGYVNDLGQSLVPSDSRNLYTFRTIYDPRPDSYALSTGSVYITTGMLSMLDNEAQLAYVLSHEVAHVERNHFYNTLRGQILEDALAIEQQRSRQRRAGFMSALGAAAGGIAGGAAQGWSGAANYAMLGGVAGFVGTSIYNGITGRPKSTEWDDAQERDADELALTLALQKNFDVREAPKLLAALERNVTSDPRVGFGFHGSKTNIDLRKQIVQSQIQGRLQSDIDSKTGLVASSPNFSVMMAALKRDNGVLAMQYDLFDMSKQNLEQAAAIRSSDPMTEFYLGKLYRMTARSEDSHRAAAEHFRRAIDLDADRGFYPEAHLELALLEMDSNDPEAYPEIQKLLKTYVTLFQNKNGGALPQNIQVVYDYLSMTGDESWNVAQVVNVASKN